MTCLCPSLNRAQSREAIIRQKESRLLRMRRAPSIRRLHFAKLKMAQDGFNAPAFQSHPSHPLFSICVPFTQAARTSRSTQARNTSTSAELPLQQTKPSLKWRSWVSANSVKNFSPTQQASPRLWATTVDRRADKNIAQYASPPNRETLFQEKSYPDLEPEELDENVRYDAKTKTTGVATR